MQCVCLPRSEWATACTLPPGADHLQADVDLLCRPGSTFKPHASHQLQLHREHRLVGVLFVALGWSLHCDGNDRPAVARDERGVVVEYLAAEKGFGRLSMEQGLYPWLRTQGQKTEWRITLASNIESMGFYGRLGFVYGTCLYPVEIQPPARDLPRLDDKSITAIYHGSSAIDALASPDARAAVDLFIAVIRQLHAHALGLGISGREATTPSARTPPLLTSRRSRWFRGINLGFVMHFTVSASL